MLPHRLVGMMGLARAGSRPPLVVMRRLLATTQQVSGGGGGSGGGNNNAIKDATSTTPTAASPQGSGNKMTGGKTTTIRRPAGNMDRKRSPRRHMGRALELKKAWKIQMISRGMDDRVHKVPYREVTNEWHDMENWLGKKDVDQWRAEWVKTAKELNEAEKHEREGRENAKENAKKLAQEKRRQDVKTTPEEFVPPEVAHAVGRRKEASASIWMKNGTGKFFVTNKSRTLVEYFDTTRVLDILEPFRTVGAKSMFDVEANVQGGGLSGQAGAIRLGVSRALIQMNPSWRPALKLAGFLTRDSRVVESKKPGQPKARKKFQWTKR